MTEPYFERLITEYSTAVTPPNLLLTDFIPLERLQALQDTFSISHSVMSVITDPKGNWITQPSQFSPLCQVFRQSSLGKDRCRLTFDMLVDTLGQNRLPAWRSCMNCELVEGGIPLVAGDRHFGNWFIGQVNALNIAQDRIEEQAWTHDVDVAKVRSALPHVTVMSMKQYEQTLNCLAAFAGEVVQQAYQRYFLYSELQRAKQQEKELREKGMNLAHSGAELQRFLRSLAYELQALLREAAGYASEDDVLNVALSDAESRQIVTRQLRSIRRIYRSVLGAVAGTHATVSEAEREMARVRLSNKKHPVEGKR